MSTCEKDNKIRRCQQPATQPASPPASQKPDLGDDVRAPPRDYLTYLRSAGVSCILTQGDLKHHFHPSNPPVFCRASLSIHSLPKPVLSTCKPACHQAAAKQDTTVIAASLAAKTLLFLHPSPTTAALNTQPASAAHTTPHHANPPPPTASLSHHRRPRLARVCSYHTSLALAPPLTSL